MPATPGVTAPEAGLGRRMGAVVYETLVVAAIVLVAGFALAPVVSPSAGPSGPLVLPTGPGRAAGLAGLVSVLGLYFGWFWTGGRCTLPMKTWHLALVDRRGEPLRAGRALARYAAAWLGPVASVALVAGTQSRAGWLALAFPYAWAFVDPARCFLHDRVAGTRLVRRD
ncbi:MAG TPA: RDD family protein [Casimicrobiaceae bacterium]|nr:RDD family protein [Casimicrobiaceae bacterium]